MAKLKAPLLSLGASGAIGEAIVYFPWKGLDVAREYVVPANPNTALQQTQRGYLSAAVIDIHAAQGHATNPLVEADAMAYALWGSNEPSPRTWFNQAIKNALDVARAGNTPTVFRAAHTTPLVDSLGVGIYSDEIDAVNITAATFFYGTSKTALINSLAGIINAPANYIQVVIPNLVTGQKYFWQLRVDVGENCEGSESGIYYGYPL